MSLLNDALKRASQSQVELDTVRIHLPPPAPTSKAYGGRGWALPVLVILLIATAGAFIWLAHFGRSRVSQVTTAAAVRSPVQAVPAAPKPSVPKPAPPPTTVAVAAPAPVLPPLKLQGITYYNAKWQAIINGKTVYVGDNVNGFRVAVISRNYVSFVAPDGSKKMIPLGE
jgi:hypothetical protein